MPPSKVGDTFMVELIISDFVVPRIEELMRIQETDPGSKRLTSSARIRPDLRALWNPMPHGRYQVKKEGWKPHWGGLEFAIGERMRVPAVIRDPDMCQLLLEQDRTRRRGALTLQRVNGVWYGHVRYRDARGGLTGSKDRRSLETNKTVSAA